MQYWEAGRFSFQISSELSSTCEQDAVTVGSSVVSVGSIATFTSYHHGFSWH